MKKKKNATESISVNMQFLKQILMCLVSICYRLKAPSPNSSPKPFLMSSFKSLVNDHSILIDTRCSVLHSGPYLLVASEQGPNQIPMVHDLEGGSGEGQ